MNMKVYEISGSYGIAGLLPADQSLPTLLPNQVLIKMQAFSLNFRDLLVVKGVDKWRPPAGRIPLSDGVGVVVEKGHNVTTLDLQDRVAGLFYPFWQEGSLSPEKVSQPLGGARRDGVLREYMVFEEREVIKVPAYLTNEEAATLPCAALTAWNGLVEKGSIGSGKTVLVQGTGGVSLFSAQLALALGADVILLSSSDEKLERAGKLGIQKLINYKRTPNWEQTVLNYTTGKGADHIVEVVGGHNINRSADALAYGGMISLIGLIGGLETTIETSKLLGKEVQLQGVEVGSRQMFQHMNDFLSLHNIHPIVDKIYPFEEARAALTFLDQGSHYGKISITVS